MRHKNRFRSALSLITASACVFAAASNVLPEQSIQVDAAETTYLYGDLNIDGTVNVSDLALLKQYLVTEDYQLSDPAVRASDVTGDDAVTADDAKMMMDYLLGRIAGFTAGASFTISDELDVYWAIEATYGNAVYENYNEGFAGEAYVNYDNDLSSYISWTVDAEEGNNLLTFRYANGGTTDRLCKIYINGDTSQYYEISFPPTGGWTTWTESTIVVPLNAGSNVIRVVSGTNDGGPNMDYLTLASTDADSAPTKTDGPGTITGSGQYQVENLDRGVIAVNTGKGILVSWRILGTDDANTVYKVYKNGVNEVIYEGTINSASCYLDSSGTTSDWYTVDVYQAGACTEFACFATQLYENVSSGGVMNVPLNIPAGVTTPDGVTCTYSANDCTVGDVDGDGQYEIIVKWNPSNAQDNSKAGYTGNVYVDCYELDGTQRWRIDLGINIRAGAHYTQLVCGDFDADGKAELCMKTSDGTKDGQGNVIGNASADYRNSSGYVLSGNEYYTLFDGETGKALDTINYNPPRGTVSDWGDGYGNRVDRFLGAVMYIDGRQCAVTVRGYYTRMTAACYTVENDKLVEKWYFDSNNSSCAAAYGGGNHNCMPADVDGDGNFELILGAACIDDDGTLLWGNGNGHGDAMHLGCFEQNSSKLYLWVCHEVSPYGCSLIDPATGATIFRIEAGGDTGRGIAGNYISGNNSAEFANGGDGNLYNLKGEVIGTWAGITKWGMNSNVYWDGDLEREVLDRTMVDGYGKGREFTGSDMAYNNSSKSNACLTADLFGDWREEMIFASGDSTKLRIVSTTYATEYGICSLMHNPQYRCQVAGQNISYNQPPNTSFWLGTGDALPGMPDVYSISGQ